MDGRIPMLPRLPTGGERTDIILPSTLRAHARNYSTGCIPSPAQAAPRAPPRRQSQPPPSSLPALPRCREEWKKTIGDIKRQHANRKFRACAARCNEILNGVDISVVEPTYLISLRFYAATSLEMCACSLGSASNYRTSLLQQARAHYDHAAALLQRAQESVGTLSRRGSDASSAPSPASLRSPSPVSSPPSLHSPAGSVSSDASWSSASDAGAAAGGGAGGGSSILCSSGALRRGCRPKKKVSFELPRDAAAWPAPAAAAAARGEPLVRPDSPTLGFDDEYAAAMVASTPPAPKRGHHDLLELRPAPLRLATGAAAAAAAAAPPASSSSSGSSISSSSSGSSDASDSDSDGEPARAGPAPPRAAAPRPASPCVGRYCGHVEALKAQVARHIASLEAMLDSAAEPGPAPGPGPGPGPGGKGERGRQQERAARIERLRGEGWRRRRFDAARYEALCEAVMAELNS